MTESESALLRDLADWVEKELATDEDLLRAAEVQRRLSPRRSPDTPGLQVAGACLPSRQVGGDLYDWQVVNGRVQVMLADVMGKGLSAALVGAGVRATIRGASRFNDVSNTLTRAAASLEDDLTDLSMFVTVFLARIDPITGELDYVDAGHNLAVVFGPDGTVRRLVGDGLPLGISPGDSWTSRSDRLADGETLLIISDGVLDVFPTGEAAVAEASRQLAEGIDCEEAVQRIIAFAVGHDRADDVTAIAVRKVSA
jgi:serine phosphatase RsbU (regulator of sigma subunit)